MGATYPLVCMDKSTKSFNFSLNFYHSFNCDRKRLYAGIKTLQQQMHLFTQLLFYYSLYWLIEIASWSYHNKMAAIFYSP